MIFEVIKTPEKLFNDIIIPPDKSISHRAILLNILAHGKEARITNFLFSDDTEATLEFARSIGNVIECDRRNNTVHLVKGLLHDADKEIDCANSGTTARLCISVLAALGLRGVITGDQSLLKRPMTRITGFLRDMNANIYDNCGKLPVFVSKSVLQRNNMVSEIGSAQQKTAWIISNLFAVGDKSFYRSKKTSRDHTERMLKEMGCMLDISSSEQYSEIISLCDNTYLPEMKDITVPSDFSSAAFFVVFGLLCENCRLRLKSININPTRAYLLEILVKMGGDIQIENQREIDGEPVGDIIVNSSKLHGIIIDEIEKIPFFIDEIPILAVAMLFARGSSQIHGIGELRVKESDRVQKTIELGAFAGKKIYEKDDIIYISDEKILNSEFINADNDHRIIMSAIILSVLTQRKLKLDSISGINVSFPGFLNKFMEFGYEFKYSN